MQANTKPMSHGMAEPAVPAPAEGTARLLRLAASAEELSANRVADEGRDLAARVLEGRFYVACLGQFKRGKSTLINALIGDPILPVGFLPITTLPTVIRFGAERSVRIQSRDGAWQEISPSDLAQYVSEEHNPENTKGVNGVEVFVPSPILSTGMCLVDTPAWVRCSPVTQRQLKLSYLTLMPHW
jgi:ribosome biogenesis GTPase A